MPRVATEGPYQFVINTKENEFEPPHVHVKIGGVSRCRIELNGGTFMELPPAGHFSSLQKAYEKHVATIWAKWDEYHEERML
jgi:hypothetical protein